MIDGRRGRTGTARADGRTEQTQRRGTGFGAWLVRHGVRADAITVLGILLAAGNAVLIGLGDFYVACALLIVGGLMDTLDGVVAKAAGTSSPRGAFFDSVSDRVADGLLFGGMAWYLAGRSDPRLALVPLAILGVSALISYERAKAESLGFSAKGGLMERAERLILFGLAMLIHVVLVPLLVALLVLSCVTAFGRFVRVWRQASGAAAARPATAVIWSRARVESRWRSWRESGGTTSPRRGTAAGARRSRQREPLSTRLRLVLGSEHVPASRRREPSGRDRSVRALRRRLDGER